MAEAQVPAPASTSTKPKKMIASVVVRAQGLLMWITQPLPSQAQNTLALLYIYDSNLFFRAVDNSAEMLAAQQTAAGHGGP